MDYLNAGADTLSFHVEAAKHAHRICSKIKAAGKRAGVALNPGTHHSAIEYLSDVMDQVTIMTVNPGFSRQSHLNVVHRKIEEIVKFREKHDLSFDIMVDGGVNHTNAADLLRMGVQAVVAGGAVFNYEDYREAIQKIKTP
jgi:ribulose-phosphate 3-epimerase